MAAFQCTINIIHRDKFVPARGSAICSLPLPSFLPPRPVPMRVLPRYIQWSAVEPKSEAHILASHGTEVAVQDLVSSIPHQDVVISQAPNLRAETSVKNIVRSRRGRPIRKSEMPPVKTDALLPGASFTGKVRSIQPFGAFVDIGAFTEGLIHVSNLSDDFVTDVKSIVAIGQEVRVRVVEASVETGRISLTMRESSEVHELPQRKDSPPGNSGNETTPARKSKTRPKQKSSKFIKGQELEGSVKNLARSGSFISLPEGEEGFLPKSEESVEDFENIMGGSSLQIGQDVRVRVLYVTKGHVTLTMKNEEDGQQMNPDIIHVGVVHEATNPFVLAFLKNKDIAKLLDERENMQRLAGSS